MAATLASMLFLAPEAGAHVSLASTRIEASSTRTLTFVAPSEHDLPMVALRVSLPAGMAVLDGSTRGWRFAVDKGTAIWSGGRVAPYGTGSFLLRVRAPEQAGDHRIVAAQRYADGHDDRWDVTLAVTARGQSQQLVAAVIAGTIGVALIGVLLLFSGRRRG